MTSKEWRSAGDIFSMQFQDAVVEVCTCFERSLVHNSKFPFSVKTLRFEDHSPWTTFLAFLLNSEHKPPSPTKSPKAYTVEPRSTDTRLIRTPGYCGHLRLSRRKAHIFSLQINALNTDNGHFSVSRVTNSHTSPTPLYGH